MIRSGVPDVPLPKDIVLQVTVEKGKRLAGQGSKSPRTRSQVTDVLEGKEDPMEEDEEAINCENRGSRRKK